MSSMEEAEQRLSQLRMDITLKVAGNTEALEALRELILWPQLYAKEAAILGVEWPSGLLLYGPPGCGKTFMTQAVCSEGNVVLKTVLASDIFGAFMGESEKALRSAFETASKEVENGRIVVLFFDEIEALCPPRQADHQHESRVVSQLLTLMDGASTKKAYSNGRLVIVAATNRPNALDPALRRPGRFDREIEVTAPDSKQRCEILKIHSQKLRLGNGISLETLAERTHGYSGADLAALCREAVVHAISSAEEINQDSHVSVSDFEYALTVVSPSISRSYEVRLASVNWSDIGGLEDVKKKLRQTTEWPFTYREAFDRIGIRPAKGVLLYGPPGCCKTTLAIAVANGCNARLFSLSCAQIYSMYSGEGETIVRDVFRRARIAAPSIVLLDEVDAMAVSRSLDDARSGSVERRLLSCLLTEMDGLMPSKNVLVLAATNRPEVLDPAILRPGRLDLLLFVGLPNEDSRTQILQILTKDIPLDTSVDFNAISQRTQQFTGAELSSLCTEAALCALREDVVNAPNVKMVHFEQALNGIKPSITMEMIDAYQHWGKRNKRR